MLSRVLFAASLVACGGEGFKHVTFPSPPPTLTPQQRVDTFAGLRTGHKAVATVTRCTRNGSCSTTSTPAIELVNGTQVAFPEDLRPLVAADSETRRHADAVARARRSSRNWGIAGGVAIAVGLLSFVAGSSRAVEQAGIDDGVLLRWGITGGMFLGGGVLWGYSHVHYDGTVNDESNLTFRSYDADLAQTLNVCVQGLGVVPCEGAPASPSFPSAPPPAFPVGPPSPFPSGQ